MNFSPIIWHFEAFQVAKLKSSQVTFNYQMNENKEAGCL